MNTENGKTRHICPVFRFFFCEDLESIYIPEGVAFDDQDGVIFESSGNVTIYGVAGSTAEEYANTYEIPFVAGNIPA